MPGLAILHKYISFGEKVVKIGPVDPTILWPKKILKKQKKLTHAKHIAGQASLPGGLNNCIEVHCMQDHSQL